MICNLGFEFENFGLPQSHKNCLTPIPPKKLWMPPFKENACSIFEAWEIHHSLTKKSLDVFFLTPCNLSE